MTEAAVVLSRVSYVTVDLRRSFSYKVPRAKITTNPIFLFMAMFNFQTNMIGNRTNVASVTVSRPFN